MRKVDSYPISGFSVFPSTMLFIIGFSYTVFAQLECAHSFYAQFLQVFYQEGMLGLPKGLSASIRMIIYIFLLFLFVCF